MLKKIKKLIKTMTKRSLLAAAFALIAPPAVIVANYNQGWPGVLVIVFVTALCAYNLYLFFEIYKIALKTESAIAEIKKLEASSFNVEV